MRASEGTLVQGLLSRICSSLQSAQEFRYLDRRPASDCLCECIRLWGFFKIDLHSLAVRRSLLDETCCRIDYCRSSDCQKQICILDCFLYSLHSEGHLTEPDDVWSQFADAVRVFGICRANREIIRPGNDFSGHRAPGLQQLPVHRKYIPAAGGAEGQCSG